MPLIFCPSDDSCTTWLFGNYAPNKETQNGQYASTWIPNLTVDVYPVATMIAPISPWNTQASLRIPSLRQCACHLIRDESKALMLGFNITPAEIAWQSLLWSEKTLQPCNPVIWSVGFTKHRAWSSTILAATAAGSTPIVSEKTSHWQMEKVKNVEKAAMINRYKPSMLVFPF